MTNQASQTASAGVAPRPAPAAGHRFPETTFTVEPVRVEEFLLALGVDPAAGYAPEPGSYVPLGFLMYVTTLGAETVNDALGLEFERTLYGGQELEVLAPVRVGDRLRVAAELTKVTRKDGKRGPLVFYEITCDYHLPDGTLAVRERSTTIERPVGRGAE